MTTDKYIIKQVPPEAAELMYYFDGDTFTENAGGLQYALFVIVADRWSWSPVINADLWSSITSEADELADAFADVGRHYWNRYSSFKEAMHFEARDIKYSPRTCHALKEWASNSEFSPSYSRESIAEYLTIKTGRPWTVASATGYCQGDYAEIVYCEDVYTQEDAEAAGEIALGAANEYSITFPAEDGSEPETVYGYIVADCQGWRPEDAKRLVCKWEGIDPADAVLMTCEKVYTSSYTYKEVC